MKCRAPFFVLLVLVGCAKPAPVPEQPGDDSSSRTTTAFNAPSTPQEMAGKCDVPIYPGGQAPDNLSRMPRTDNDGNTNLELVLTSKDAPLKVADYYSKELKIPVSKEADAFSIVGKTPHGNDLIIQISHEGGQTVVRVHSIAHRAA